MTLKAWKKGEQYLMKTPLMFALVEDAPSAGLLNEHMSNGASTSEPPRCVSALQRWCSAEVAKLAVKELPCIAKLQTSRLAPQDTRWALCSSPGHCNQTDPSTSVSSRISTTRCRQPLKWRTSQGYKKLRAASVQTQKRADLTNLHRVVLMEV